MYLSSLPAAVLTGCACFAGGPAGGGEQALCEGGVLLGPGAGRRGESPLHFEAGNTFISRVSYQHVFR